MKYQAPDTVQAAVDLLANANGSAKVLAGGTDLLVQLRSGRIKPDLVVDLKKIPQLRALNAQDGGYRVGAAVAGAELGEHSEVKKLWPGVVEALELIGSTQIQGRASLGGNLCNASPAADSVPAMIAAAVTCTIAGPNGERQAAVEDIMTGPGQTSLAQGEFIVDFYLPPRRARSADAYLRFIPRTEMDIAVVGTGVDLSLDDNGVCTRARVGLGAVAPKALLVDDAADALIGSQLDDNAVDTAVQAIHAACNPINDKRGTIEYRVKVAGVLFKRTVAIAAERAKRG